MIDNGKESAKKKLFRKKRRENTFTLQPDYFDARETLLGNMYVDITLKNMLLPYGFMSTI